MALTEELRRDWTQLRYEFYVAGRVLWFNGCWSIAAMNFGYAAETTLKHLLAERSEARKDRETFKHNIDRLVAQCREAAILDDYISDDLIHYLDDRLNFRYPKQRASTAEEARARSHGIGQAYSDIVALDDAILHLDEAAVRLTGQSRVSVLRRGAASLDSQDGQAFFHSNGAAMARLATAERYLSEHRQDVMDELRQYNPHLVEINDNSLKEISRRLEQMRRDGAPQENMPTSVSAEEQRPAATFRYPCRVIRDEDGNVIGLGVSSTSDVLNVR